MKTSSYTTDDVASVMSLKMAGVQAKIKEISPQALYYCHCLNPSIKSDISLIDEAHLFCPKRQLFAFFLTQNVRHDG